jgi:hypothetical protein
VWLIIPLVYFLGWWQTGSLRQAFNGTIAWIVAFSAVALALLALDVGGFSGMTATPDSPAAGIAILGGFIGMWISNYVWRRRGGDPERKQGKWERSIRAMLGMDKKKKSKKKKKPAMQGPPPQQQMPPPPPQQQVPPPPPQQAPSSPAPMEADYRPASGSSNQAPPQQPPPVQQPPVQQAPPPQQQPDPGAPQFQQVQQPPPQPAPVKKKKKQRQNSETADRYAKATGRALGAMFRGSDKKKSKSPPGR